MLSMARVAAALASVILGCTVLGIASGCAPPEHTYVANSANHTYFKVPASWHEIDQSALQQTTTGASPTPQSDGEWVVAYDAAEVPSPATCWLATPLTRSSMSVCSRCRWRRAERSRSTTSAISCCR